MGCSPTLLALMLCLGMTGNPAAAKNAGAHSADRQSARLLSSVLAEITSETVAQARERRFYELLDRIEKRELTLDSSSDAAALALFMADRMERDPSRLIRGRAAEFLASNPHPAAADALFRVASLPDSVDRSSPPYARAALASLHDRRVLPLLLAHLKAEEGPPPPQKPRPAYVDRAVPRQLVDLGDPAAIGPLQALADRPDLLPSCRKTLLDAIQDLKLLADAHIVNRFDLDDHARRMLRERGFVICPARKNEMFELYDEAYPFVTSDVMMHTFMILSRATLDELEALVLSPQLASFAVRAQRASLDQSRTLQNRHLRSLAERNAAFLAVPAILLGAEDSTASQLPPAQRDPVREEVRRIAAHQGQADSRILECREDYTKYAPRGRGSSDPARAGYYRAMLYLGRMTFRLDSTEETERAFLLADVLARDSTLSNQWSALDGILGTFFGARDDLAPTDYMEAARDIPGGERKGSGDLPDLAGNPSALRAAIELLEKRPLPRINSALVTSVQDASDWQVRKAGMRVFGQRYTRPMELFQRVMDAKTWPPSGLMVAADLMGSRRAGELLYGANPASTTRPHPRVPTPARAEGDSSLVEGIIDCASTLFDPPPAGPAFMRQTPWEEKQINAALGAWAEAQHATTLYTKDANTYLGVSAMLDRFHGYVEPAPDFYRRMRALSTRMRRLADRYDLFAKIEADTNHIGISVPQVGRPDDDREEGPRTPIERMRREQRERYAQAQTRKEAAIRLTRANWEELDSILEKLGTIAEKELNGAGQSIDDGIFLKNLHSRLMVLSFNRSGTNVAQKSMAVITDVATEYQSGQCLEVGVGRPLALYAAIPDGDRTIVCKGAVYTYYEFLQPIEGRLDDTAWQRISEYPDECPHAPWLATREDLGFIRVLSRDEMVALRSLATGDGSAEGGGLEPWRAQEYSDEARDLAGATISREDLDLLIDLARAPSLNLGVRTFALRRLADFGTDPRVVACYAEQLKELTPGRSMRSNLDIARLYYSVRGLGHCGSRALPMLQEAEEVLPGLNGDTREVLQDMIREARASIGKHPAGYDTGM